MTNVKQSLPTFTKPILLIATLLLSGCASVERFNNKYPEYDNYIATQLDIDILKTAFNSKKGASCWSGCGLAKLLAPFAVIDIPFSLVTDSIMLPLDIYNTSKNQNDSLENRPPVIDDDKAK